MHREEQRSPSRQNLKQVAARDEQRSPSRQGFVQEGKTSPLGQVTGYNWDASTPDLLSSTRKPSKVPDGEPAEEHGRPSSAPTGRLGGSIRCPRTRSEPISVRRSPPS